MAKPNEIYHPSKALKVLNGKRHKTSNRLPHKIRVGESILDVISVLLNPPPTHLEYRLPP